MASYAAGVYQCRIIGQGFGESKTKGTPFFYLDIQPLHEIINDEPTELPEDCRWARRIERYITDKTFDYLVEDLKAIGWQGGPLSDLGPDGGTSFVDTELRCRCQLENASDGSDKIFERWMLWRPTSGGTQAPPEKTLDKTGLRKLDALFGDKLKSAFGGKAVSKPVAKKPAAVQRETVPAHDPDVPF